MVGLRVFDVGALVVWLVWFFRLRDDDDDDGDDFRRGTATRPSPRSRAAPAGCGCRCQDARPWPSRRRDHRGDRPAAPRSRRAPHPVPARAPSKR